jgi:transcriptional regulator with GAF, ATPase, and Fis domain
MLAAMFLSVPPRRVPAAPSNVNEPTLIGQSPAIRQLYEAVQQVADSPSTVLVLGETGTGKELVAKVLHDLSSRCAGPFVAVNCAAIPDDLIENELFGHERGAFTDAHATRRGRFEVANGGTLFLDEIGDLSVRAQGNLLRVIEERAFSRVGGSQPIQVDVRLIGATNVDLEQAVQAGRFREDLYHRLNVVPIRVPPLRERADDIPALVEHFLVRANRTRGSEKTIAPEVMDRLVAYDWPGNVREMENLLERLVTLSAGPVIQDAELPLKIRARARTRTLAEEVRRGAVSLTQAVDAFERELILDALDRTAHVQVRAAKALGVTRRILKYKMDALGIPVQRPRARPVRRQAA